MVVYRQSVKGAGGVLPQRLPYHIVRVRCGRAVECSRQEVAEGGVGGELAGEDQPEQVIPHVLQGGFRGESVAQFGGESVAAVGERGGGEVRDGGDRTPLLTWIPRGQPPDTAVAWSRWRRARRAGPAGR